MNFFYTIELEVLEIEMKKRRKKNNILCQKCKTFFDLLGIRTSTPTPTAEIEVFAQFL